jgi:CelD/BcsL family acetyltransferase involved in cellulose biosynthesis
VHVAGHRGGPAADWTVERATSLVELRREWDELAEPDLGIFATWEWADAWWRCFGQGELLLHVARSAEGVLRVILPLYASQSLGVRVVRFLGHGPGDELGPLHRPADVTAAAAALRTVLADQRWDVFLGEQLPGGRRWADLLGAAPWRREASPVLRLPDGGWSAYLASRSSNFRDQLTRRSRALERARAVFRLAAAETLERDLDVLFALHRARWEGRRTDFAEDPFHRKVARAALRRDWLRLWLLELDGRPVAAWYGFHVGSVTSYYQAGRDPAFGKLSAGFVLLARTIQAAIAEGASEYRFGRGAEAFKYRFTADDPGLESVALARGLRGRSVVALGRIARRLGR